jgi:hypothetical protein
MFRGFQKLIIRLQVCVSMWAGIRQQVIQHPAYRVHVYLHHGTDTRPGV